MTRYTRAGYNFESIFKKSVENSFPDAFIYKLIDTTSISGLLSVLKKNYIQYNNFLIPKVPSDFIIINEGRTLWIECKSTKNLTSFPIRNIKTHQLKFASEIEASGAQYFFALRRDEPRKGRVFIVPAHSLFKIKIGLGNSKKSIKWRYFEEDPDVIEAPRIKGSIYDLRKIF